MANKFFMNRVKKQISSISEKSHNMERLTMLSGLEKICNHVGLDEYIFTDGMTVTVDEVLEYFKTIGE